MEKAFDWLTARFSNPFSLLFFLLGSTLLLLGLSTGFQIPFINNTLAPADDSREVSLLLGTACLLFAIYIHNGSRSRSGFGNLGNLDLPDTFFGRKALISKTQRDLLEFVEKNAPILLSEILISFKPVSSNKSELYYRLEHLRLLGFIEREKMGKAGATNYHDLYRLTEPYQAEINKTIGTAISDTTNEGASVIGDQDSNRKR